VGDPLSSLISGAMLCALAFIMGYIAARLWQWRNKERATDQDEET
jgi:hypothetical protein